MGIRTLLPHRRKGAAATPFATGKGSQVFATAGKGKPVRNETMHSSIVAYDPALVTAAWKLVLTEAHQRSTKYRRSGSPSSLSRHIQQNYLLTERTCQEHRLEKTKPTTLDPAQMPRQLMR